MDQSELLPGVFTNINILKQNNQPIALGSASKNARFWRKQELFTTLTQSLKWNDVSNAKPDQRCFFNCSAVIK
jgi:beta-phosphoglucomutase